MTDHKRARALNRLTWVLLLSSALVLAGTVGGAVLVLTRSGPVVTIPDQPAPGWEILRATHNASTWNAPCGHRPNPDTVTGQDWHAWRDGDRTVTAAALRFGTVEDAANYYAQVRDAATSTCDGWTDESGQRWELTSPTVPDQPPIARAAHPAPSASTTTWRAGLPGGAGQAWASATIKDHVLLVSIDSDPQPDTDTATRVLVMLTTPQEDLPQTNRSLT